MCESNGSAFETTVRGLQLFFNTTCPECSSSLILLHIFQTNELFYVSLYVQNFVYDYVYILDKSYLQSYQVIGLSLKIR
jgi:hypothetical protein